VELSSEDLLRINVLLVQPVEAIRIDEQDLVIHALLGGAEARITLNPNCRPELYLRRVREVLSNHALGSPGGYPAFLQRWTRMGQVRGGQLDKLLLLGDPEAVVAVAGAADLTPEFARRAWWCQPTIDNARRLLAHESIARDPMGRMLAGFLVEHLAFETDHLAVIATIKLVLQPGLIDEATRRRIWVRANHRNAYRLGFLAAAPNHLPDPVTARTDFPAHAEPLAALALTDNDPARLLRNLLDAPGQTFLAVAAEQLRHPLDKFTAAALLNVIGEYFAPARTGAPVTEMSALRARAESDCASAGGDIERLRAAVPTLRREMTAMLALAHTSEALALPIISQTTATGTLLQRKLAPVTDVLLASFRILRGTPM
jgi:hypothetical protein